MPATALRFCFDYVSPNAYLAWTQLPALVGPRGVSVEPVPVLFAGLLEAHQRVGPAEIPAHIRWMWKNVLRKSTLLHVPFQPPVFHPFNPLLALRVSSLSLAASDRTRLIDALFKAVWVRSLHVSEPEVVRRVADEIGLPGAALVEKASGQGTKELLHKQTDDAISRGVFGVPTMEIGGELFWGYDDFPYLAMYLDGRDSVDEAAWEPWSEPRKPSAIREMFRRKQ